MPTQSLSDALKATASENTAFADGLLQEAVNALLAGDTDDGRILLRSYVHATIGFAHLARLTDKSAEALMRNLGPDGNPTTAHLLEIIASIGRAEGMTIAAHVSRIRADATS